MLLTHECLYRWAGRLTQRTIETGRTFAPVLTIGLHFKVERGYKIPRRLTSLRHDIPDYPPESDRRFHRVSGAIGSLWRSQ